MKLWWLWISIAALVALGVGAALPPPPLPKPAPVADNWTIPARATQPKGAPEGSNFDAVPWDTVAAAAQKKATWRLAGILNSRIALLQSPEAKELIRVMIGNPLPDGALLRSVDKDRITIEQNDCVQVYKLYFPEPASSSGNGCPAPATPPATAASAAPKQEPRGAASPTR